MTIGNYDRSGDAEYFAAGADQSSSASGPYEEPDGAEQDCEAHQCWYYQDAVRRAWERGLCPDVLTYGENMKFITAKKGRETRGELVNLAERKCASLNSLLFSSFHFL